MEEGRGGVRETPILSPEGVQEGNAAFRRRAFVLYSGITFSTPSSSVLQCVCRGAQILSELWICCVEFIGSVLCNQGERDANKAHKASCASESRRNECGWRCIANFTASHVLSPVLAVGGLHNALLLPVGKVTEGNHRQSSVRGWTALPLLVANQHCPSCVVLSTNSRVLRSTSCGSCFSLCTISTSSRCP